jgi:hypothetical protein
MTAAFHVDQLHPTNPEYQALDEHLVYVDATGHINWVTADTKSFGCGSFA